MIKNYESRAWLSKKDVSFKHRANKDEFIRQTWSHAQYLEASGSGGCYAEQEMLEQTVDDKTAENALRRASLHPKGVSSNG